MKRPSLKTDKPRLSFGSIFEMWILSTIFIVVMAGLLQLQKLQVSEQSEVAREMDQRTHTISDFTRNNTPALGY